MCTLGEPLDPTPLSVVQHEYATQIEYLLSAVTVPGLTQEQLSIFKTLNRSYAFVCRFPGCTGMLAGFPTDDLRTQHEMTHKLALFCTQSGCKYSLPFASQQTLRKHIRDYHDSRPKVVSKSIRRRKATLLRGKSEYDGQYNGGEQYRTATKSSIDAPSQYRSTPTTMASAVDQTPEFPAHLTSMESSASEDELLNGSQNSVLFSPSTWRCTYHGCSQRFKTPQKLQKHKRESH